MGASPSTHRRRPTNMTPDIPSQPPPDEVERQFNELIQRFDLPPDKAKKMRSYDLSTKWVKICEAKALEPKESPNEYLKKLSAYMNPEVRKSHIGKACQRVISLKTYVKSSFQGMGVL